jgi:hypothetical protein
MSHVVTLRLHPTDPDLVCLCTPIDMAHTMGGFGAARYVGNAPPINGASYVIGSDDLPRFRVFATHHATHIVDARTPTNVIPLGRGAPLPECTHCGQPARRGARLNHCPNCGAPWDATEIGAPYSRGWIGAVTTCDQCSSDTPSGYAHCIHCGAPHA